MYEAIFDLEAITPLFMRGADARSPEFSSASVKGVMRWWFRALAGGYFGNNIEALKEVEEKIFGSTRNKSRVFVRAEVEDVKKGNIYRQASSWADKTIIVWSEYVDYFFFSVLDKRRNRKTKKIDIKTRFEYFDVGSKFSISLSSTDERYFRLAEASLWMTINLGGFGFRARRGAGSLKVTNAEGDVTLNFTKFDSLKKFSQELSNVVSQFNKAIRELDIKFEQSGREKEHYPNYPTFDQENSLVFTNEEWAASGKKETWIKALDNFGRWYLGRRRGRKFIDGFRFKFADYTLSHALEKVKEDSIIKTVNSEPLKEKRYYLGLPIRYANYGTTVSGWSGDLPLENKKLKKDNIVHRRASGYWLSLIDINGTIYPTVTVFAYQFYPNYRGAFYFEKQDNKTKARGLIYIYEDNYSAYLFYKRWIENIVQNSDKGKFVVLWPKKS